jgi:CBS domain containing-hemolysin-like protein
VSNIGVFVILARLLISQEAGYVLVFFVAVCIFAVFSFIIPYSWAKYTAETILSRTHRLLEFSAWAASPVLSLLSVHDTLVRRLAGISEASPEEAQEEKQGRF